VHTKQSLRVTGPDLFGWGNFSWLLLLLGLWAVRRLRGVWLIASVYPALVLAYFPYWVSGPRYFFEGLYSLTLLSAAGIAWLAGWLPEPKIPIPAEKVRLRQGLVLAGFIALLIFATLPYTPVRLHEIKNRYGFTRDDLAPLLTEEAQERTPALIIVHTAFWREYGVYLHLQDPQLTTPFIFVWALKDEDPTPELTPCMADRTIYHYYPDEPGIFYGLPRP
jgi:hypothetical protein